MKRMSFTYEVFLKFKITDRRIQIIASSTTRCVGYQYHKLRGINNKLKMSFASGRFIKDFHTPTDTKVFYQTGRSCMVTSLLLIRFRKKYWEIYYQK